MERRADSRRPLDAGYAAWLTNSTPATVGYHLACGMDRPKRVEIPHGCGPGWQGRAVAAVLRECYRRRLRKPILEEVEIAALDVLPEPADDPQRPPFAPGPHEQWERAVRNTARTAHKILCHGPASGTAGGEVLRTGEVLEAEVRGLQLEQPVDMIWRRPCGTVEAVLVFDEKLAAARPGPAENDWRCVLAAATVRTLHGHNPDVHTVWVSAGAARVARIPDEVLDGKLRTLAAILGRARAFQGLGGPGGDAFYRFAADPPFSAPAGRRRGQRSPGSARRRPE